MTPEQAAKEALAAIEQHFPQVAQALRTYGDQRAAEAREQALREAAAICGAAKSDFPCLPADSLMSNGAIIAAGHLEAAILALMNVRPEVKPSGPFSMVSNAK